MPLAGARVCAGIMQGEPFNRAARCARWRRGACDSSIGRSGFESRCARCCGACQNGCGARTVPRSRRSGVVAPLRTFAARRYSVADGRYGRFISSFLMVGCNAAHQALAGFLFCSCSGLIDETPFFDGFGVSGNRVCARRARAGCAESQTAEILGAGDENLSVAPTPVPGLYELNLGKAILYSDAQGAYLLIGKMVNAKTMENITDRRLTELNRIDFKSLPFANAIKVVKGNGARQIAVFSDPNCKHCRELEHTLSKADNLTIYTFPFPILKPDSLDKAKAIWCAPNRSAAWHAWMANRQAPGGKVSCDTDALAQNIAFGRRLNVFSTPTIFFANGYRLAGALTSEQLERAFSAVQ